MTATPASLARRAAERFRDRLSPEQNALLDAEVLARHVLGWDRTRWIAESRNAAPTHFAPRFEALVERRLRGEPVAYLTGTKEFWGLDFEVTPAVLVPRPETEILVEQALKAGGAALQGSRPGGAALQGSRELAVADIGTGSGCVAVALAHARPDISVIATDVSSDALDVARRNAARHGVADRIDFRHASVLDGVGAIDLVVSNPPYVAAHDQTLMPDVRKFEPHAALFAGGDGLDVIRALLTAVAQRHPTPPLLFEFGGNEAAVRQAVQASGLRLVEVTADLAGIPRVARVER